MFLRTRARLTSNQLGKGNRMSMVPGISKATGTDYNGLLSHNHSEFQRDMHELKSVTTKMAAKVGLKEQTSNG